jgi:hypothetical protein
VCPTPAQALWHSFLVSSKIFLSIHFVLHACIALQVAMWLEKGERREGRLSSAFPLPLGLWDQAGFPGSDPGSALVSSKPTAPKERQDFQGCWVLGSHLTAPGRCTCWRRGIRRVGFSSLVGKMELVNKRWDWPFECGSGWL